MTATYLLWAVRTSFFGPFDEKWNMLKDATTAWQKLPYVLLIVVLLTVGFCPRLLTDIIQKTVAAKIVKSELPVTVGDLRSEKVRGLETHAQQRGSGVAAAVPAARVRAEAPETGATTPSEVRR